MKKSLEQEIAKKKAEGKDRIVVSVSFKFTDPYEFGLLKHLWQFSKSHFIKRLVGRDKEGVAASPVMVMEYQEPEQNEDVSSFL